MFEDKGELNVVIKRAEWPVEKTDDSRIDQGCLGGSVGSVTDLISAPP